MITKLRMLEHMRPITVVFAVLATFAALVPLAVTAFAANPAIKLAPHRAVYDVSLAKTENTKTIASVRGRMVFEFVGSRCEGYTLNTRLVTETTTHSGTTALIDLRWSTWEQEDGEEFRFHSTHYRDRKISELSSGSAGKDPSDDGLLVTVAKPKSAEVRHAGSILFPTQHSLTILQSARKGERVVQAKVFDGSEQGRKVYETTAFIGKQQPPGKAGKTLERVANDEALDGLAAWPVTIGYFDDLSQGETKPAYETSFLMFANGVSRNVLIDYGDFAVRGTLSSLDFLTQPDCD